MILNGEVVGPKSEENFGALYSAMPDEEILKLAADGGLRPDAQAALAEQVRSRKISAIAIRAEHSRQTEAKEQIRVGMNRSYRGTGLRFYGRKFLNDADAHRGIVVVTRWITFGYMPLIPIGSYRVKEDRSNIHASKVVGPVKLQWDQVRQGWMRAALVFLFGVLLLFMTFAWFNYRDGRPLWGR